MLKSLSLCAEVVLDLHNLNSEGTEGNQQQTRMVHIVDEKGEHKIVNAVSGDMFKHIFVEHLTPLLESAGQPLSSGAKAMSPDRITVDADFRAEAKKLKASDIQNQMITRCAVTDIAGALLTEGNSVPRKSCVEFGWVVGLPGSVFSEQYFHVKYDHDRGKSAGQEPKGEGTVSGKQAIFHRPANSGVYALICHLELARIGLNDVTRVPALSEPDRIARCRAAVHALLATLVKPAGAQRNTQNPHIVDCRGIVTVSSSHLPAPTVSPLNSDFAGQMESIEKTLNLMAPGSVRSARFTSLADGVAALQKFAEEV